MRNENSDSHHAFALLTHALSIHPNAEENDPQSWKDARISIFSGDWLLAEQTRLEELKRNNVFTLVPRPKDRKVITVKPVYKTKYHPDGTFDKRSMRLAARGFQQIAGIDFYDVPVASYETIRLCLALAAILDFEAIDLIDFVAAFIQADFKGRGIRGTTGRVER